MNYVQHTRTAHERLLNEPAARPQHISLYWALFFEWNAARFPAAMSIDRATVMAAARIGNRDTYTATIRALEGFGLLSYNPSHSASGSTVSMTELGPQVSPEVSQPKPAGMPRSGPTKKAEVSPEVSLPVAAEVGQPTPEVDAEVGQHSLLYKTVVVNSTTNVGGGTEKKRREGFSDDGLSSAEVLDDTAQANGAVPSPGAAPKKKVAQKTMRIKHSEGVREAKVGTAATAGPAEPRRQRGPQQKPEVPFTDSELATYAAFEATFAGTDYALLDLRFYHEKIINWRQKGEIPKRRDWKATATQFFLNDAQDNRLKLAPGVQRHEPGTSSSNTQQPGGPATGYRSKRWD